MRKKYNGEFQMKKTLFFIVLVFSLIFALSACGKKASPDKKESTEYVDSDSGADVIDAASVEETATKIDFETGKIISKPNEEQQTDNTPSSDKQTESSDKKTDSSKDVISSDKEEKTSGDKTGMSDWEPLS